MALRNPLPEPDPLEVELLGQLRRCCKCGEWWPEDREFFYSMGENQLDHACIACRVEINLGKPCTFPGCEEPRVPRHTQCRQHHNAWQNAANRRKKNTARSAAN